LGADYRTQVESSSEPGQSYYRNGGEWLDLYDFNNTANFCIKGMAHEIAPFPVRVIEILDVGDGQSLQVSWVADDPGNVDQYRIFALAESATEPDSMDVPANVTTTVISGLIDGEEHKIYVLAVDAEGHTSRAYKEGYGTPNSLPAAPWNLLALPGYRSIELSWSAENTELDFDHYSVIRDGLRLSYATADTFLTDDDFLLGNTFHSYLVVAVDAVGNISDTVGVNSVSMRAATLEPGRVLAVNRSTMLTPYMVNEALTGEFLNDALAGFNYDYFSDTAHGSSNRPDTLHLCDMLDYEVMVLGGEAARYDDFGGLATFGGILDTIAYYLTLGGKVIMFGRGGRIYTGGDIADTIDYGSSSPDYAYNTHFHMTSRVQYLSPFEGTTIFSDLVGAHSQEPGYPDLIWDSMATMSHSDPWTAVGAIPCPSFAILTGSEPEVIYTYNSRNSFWLTEGEPVAWRYIGDDYQYIFYEIPLSFMDRPLANAALQASLSELLSPGPEAETVIDPDTIVLTVAPPPTISMYLGDFIEGKAAIDVDPSTILVNGSVSPISTLVLPSYPPFTGEVFEIVVSTSDFANTYGPIIDTMPTIYSSSWKYYGDPVTCTIYGDVILIGGQFVPGDANGDGTVDVGDAIAIINYVFKDGPEPDPFESGDANCDGFVNLADAVYLINYIFKGGLPPRC
jgi:hypothetical protein